MYQANIMAHVCETIGELDKYSSAKYLLLSLFKPVRRRRFRSINR